MTWHTLLQHEFLDRNLGNIIGAPGKLVSSNLAPLVHPSSGRGTTIAPGMWFGVNFDEIVKKVIGFDIKLLLHAPANTGLLPLCQIVGAMNVEFVWESPSHSEMVNGELVAFGDLRVKVGTEVFVIHSVGLPHRRSIELHVNWHTSGQCRIELDGQLIAYDPTLSPGQSFATQGIRLGDPISSPQLRPRHMLHQVLVRAIREEDSVTEILWELAADLPEIPDSERCRIEVERHLQSIVGILRSFMRGFTQQETQQWNKADGGSAKPFSQSAAEAHKVSMSAFLSAMEFLTRGGEVHKADYLADIRRFFELLHASRPTEFQQMLQDLDNLQRPSQRCLDYAAAWASENEKRVSSLVALANETIQIANDIAA
ncbi:MAG: malate synthase [Gammaproteobacteria bacterium]|nr:malate synthase [Gammaproteobacteria bacterium]